MIFHSDRGNQYTSTAYRACLAKYGASQSMSSTGRCYDYARMESFWALESKGELLITIMSSLGQRESRSISKNCVRGQQKRFADGKVTVSFDHFLGYGRGRMATLS
jgi:transposase InsO family protein